MFNATFSNILAISRRPVLMVEEAPVPGEKTIDHGQATGKLYHLWLRVEWTLFVIYKAWRKPTPHWLIWFWFLVFYATFSNISAISWRPVLVVEEAGVAERTTAHGQATGKLYHMRQRVQCSHFCNLQSRARTHAVLVIGLCELLGNPTT